MIFNRIFPTTQSKQHFKHQYQKKKKMEEEIKKQSEFVLKLTEMKNAGLAIDESRIQVEETTKHLNLNKKG